MQSGGVVELQQQVESLLGALVKAAAVELTKLFESKYLAAAAGRRDDQSGSVKTFYPLNATETKRSVGVQVDVDDCVLTELSAPPLSSDGNGFKECLTPTELLLTEDGGTTDPLWTPLNVQQVGADSEDFVPNFLDIEKSAPSLSQGEVVSPEKKEHPREPNISICTNTGHRRKSSAEKMYVIQQNSNVILDQTKFVCPLILKPLSAVVKSESSEQPVHSEPQQASVSTAKGKAYSPSVSDATITPAQAGVCPQNPLLLKLHSLDIKLLKPCAVQLVNLLSVQQGPPKTEEGAVNEKTGWPLPKDLRRHQSLHTGHRLCCFTQCDNGVWRLQKVVSHSRNGYTCSICGKAFQHRKILRRHERFHTGEKPYSCSICSKTFALRKSMRRHLRFHTGERPHSCTHCGKCFRLRENLKAHLRFHSGEKPYSCSTCGKTFRIQKNLEKHNLSQCGFFVPSFRTIAGL